MQLWTSLAPQDIQSLLKEPSKSFCGQFLFFTYITLRRMCLSSTEKEVQYMELGSWNFSTAVPCFPQSVALNMFLLRCCWNSQLPGLMYKFIQFTMLGSIMMWAVSPEILLWVRPVNKMFCTHIAWSVFIVNQALKAKYSQVHKSPLMLTPYSQ